MLLDLELLRMYDCSRLLLYWFPLGLSTKMAAK